MHCPSCGVEVVEEAVFCHKCGKRIAVGSQQPPPYEGARFDPVDELHSADKVMPEDAEAAAEAASDTAEAFQQGVAARQGPQTMPEEELWQGGYCAKAMIGAWILSAGIALLLIVLGIVFPHGWLWIGIVVAVLLLGIYQYLKLLYRQWNIRYTLTTLRFVHETGILRRRTDRIEVIDMDDITVEQKMLERLVGVGTIHVTSSDTSDPELVMLGIENVKQVAGVIDETRRKERHRRGLHIESI